MRLLEQQARGVAKAGQVSQPVRACKLGLENLFQLTVLKYECNIMSFSAMVNYIFWTLDLALRPSPTISSYKSPLSFQGRSLAAKYR